MRLRGEIGNFIVNSHRYLTHNPLCFFVDFVTMIIHHHYHPMKFSKRMGHLEYLLPVHSLPGYGCFNEGIYMDIYIVKNPGHLFAGGWT